MYKRINKLLILFLLCILVSSTFSFAENETVTDSNTPVTTNLEEQETTNTLSVPQEDEIKESTPKNTYITNDNVEINEDINNNLFIIANEVTINSDIIGDVFVIANKVTVSSSAYIYSNLFLCAKEATFNGLIAYDLYGVCSKFTDSETSLVYRNLYLSANEINLNGRVKGDAYLYSNTLNFSNKYGTIIYGDLHYSTKQNVDNAKDFVSGEIYYSPMQISEKSIGYTILSYFYSYARIILIVLVVLLAALWISPNFVESSGKLLKKNPLACIGFGILGFILTPMLIVLLLLSKIGSSIAVLVLGIYLLLVAICLPIVSISISKLLMQKFSFDKKSKFILLTIVSASALWILSQIPYLSIITNILILVIGIGLIFNYFILKKRAD